MTALAEVAQWLACPHCGQPLNLANRSVRCPQGHSFDVAKQGYVNLSSAAPPKNADTADMVQARADFLARGHYQPITAALRQAVQGCGRVLEVGAGTAHHLAGALAEDAWGLATDVSVAAARRAAKAHPRIASVVADTWGQLPICAHSLDAVLCVFAPRNPAEFARILRPGGRVMVVIPTDNHLRELRETAGLLSVETDKAERLRTSFAAFELLSEQTLSFPLQLSATDATQLVAMGPNAFHGPVKVPAVSTAAEVNVIVFVNAA